MRLVYKGKTKDVYALSDGNYLLKFKDTVTGHPTGEADPGGNSVVGEVEGVGSGAIAVTKYFFELLKSQGIDSHYISASPEKNEMTVRPAVPFGKGLEFVLRYVAAGGFIRRYGDYCKEGASLPAVFEVTLKDDARDDPPATAETLAALKLLTLKQYNEIRKATKKICGVIKKDLARRRLKLYDIKLEFGLVNGEVTLIDEISGGNMRVCRRGKKLSYTELSDIIMADIPAPAAASGPVSAAVSVSKKAPASLRPPKNTVPAKKAPAPKTNNAARTKAKKKPR